MSAGGLTAWQSELLDKYAPYTVLNCRKVCRQAFLEAMKLGVIAGNPFDLVKAPRAKRKTAGRALSPAEAKSLIIAAQDLRYGAAMSMAKLKSPLVAMRSPHSSARFQGLVRVSCPPFVRACFMR